MGGRVPRRRVRAAPGPDGRRGAMDVDLETRLRKLMLFRVIMVTTLLFIATYVEAVSETLLAVNPLYFVIAAMYMLTVAHAVALRFVRSRTGLAYAQVVGDLLTISALVYVAGGVRTGFLLLYPLSVLSATVLVSRRGALAIAGLATFLYGAVVAAVRLELLPASEGLYDVTYLPVRGLVYSAFVLGVASATIALLGSYLAESLRHAGHQLEKAAVEVADLRELNQVIVDSIQSGLMITDHESRIRHVNPVGEGILGRSGPSVHGLAVRDLFAASVLGRDELRARAASRALARLEVVYHHPDGADLDLGVTVTPLATGDAGEGGYLVVFQDLTEIRRLEQEVRTNEKLAAVGEMAAQLAHEIRNPLGSIRGSAQMLVGEPGLSDEQGRLLAIISRESKRLSDTLNRFLFQTRAPEKPRDVLDLRPLLEGAVTLLRSGSEVSPEHEVAFEADAGPHLCLADADQVTQVFWNLVRNGLEAMPGGGRLEVTLRRVGENVAFTVRDHGRGMGREEQRRMFTPFHSASPMGTGLGLAIVYRIVREHGGDISVRSVPLLGTEVDVRLPSVPVPAAVEARS
jgi:two-component system sensor histidine kinase PilS (NtrC family)